MVDMGAEVGQKMRSAIKAKLTELDCYVDDELPDYIMVMVANKRTKIQMNDDLGLFLKKKTSVFVDWLHLVLKKLKEVTVTNPDLYKRGSKRKLNETNDKMYQKKIKKESPKRNDESIVKAQADFSTDKSLTDDLPLNVNVKSLIENRKIVLMMDSPSKLNEESLHMTTSPGSKELEEIQSQIKNVKSRLGLKVEEEELDELELRRMVENSLKKSKNMHGKILSDSTTAIRSSTSDSEMKEHTKIVFSEDECRSSKKKSVLDRLGKSRNDTTKSVMKRLGSFTQDSRKKIKRLKNDDKESTKSSIDGNNELQSRNRNDLRNQLLSSGSVNNARQDVKKRLGICSKVTVPQINPELLEDTFKKREVVSVVKVKPRVLPPNVQQANKNLLLKAVADAQKSMAQFRSVGINQKSEEAGVSDNSELRFDKHTNPRKISQEGKQRLRKFLSSPNEESSDQEYIPASIQKMNTKAEYVTSTQLASTENSDNKQKFIVTLDGMQKSEMVIRLPAKDRLQSRKTPSPIIFERKIPDEVPVNQISLQKKKEKCKYFPLCKNGQNCEFLHPSKMCEQFPYCKFGDKCLFVHPNCKFGSSCTKRECSYNHSQGSRNAPVAVVPPVCKFFPQCMNMSCIYFHPKPCKFGMYCKNQSDCTYMHTNISSRKGLTWSSK